MHTYMLLSRPPPHVLQIGEDKRLLLVEATGDDVLGVLVSQPVGLIDAQVLPEKLFVISHLYHQGDVKHIL